MPDDLPEKYAVSFYLGEIVRNDTWVESEMKNLWQILAAGLGQLPGPGDLYPRDFADVLQRVSRLLSDPVVPRPFRLLALQTTDSVRGEHRRRRDLVHDILMVAPWHGPSVVIGARSRARYTLSELEACAENLRTAMWRMRGLHFIAPFWLPRTPAVEPDEYATRDDLISWTRIAMGEFEVVNGRVLGTLGDCPEPPGGYTSGPLA